MNISYNFADSGVVVTGGARGIGLEISKKFLQAGAKVAVWDFSSENLEFAKKELSEFAGKVEYYEVDVSKSDSCMTAAKELTFKPQVLINNAGITRDKSFAKMTEEDFDQVININLKGVFNCTKVMNDFFDPNSTNKRIINISSVVALYGNFGQTNYVAAKAGVIGMTKTWARELGKKGFTVNAIAPGFTLTPMVEAMPKEVLDGMESKVPVKRLGTTKDIANACLYLSSIEASYINGTTVSVDGGLVC